MRRPAKRSTLGAGYDETSSSDKWTEKLWNFLTKYTISPKESV